MNNESLTGSLVLVHPDFKDDPLQKQGQVGVLTYPRELDEMYVSFPGGGESVYSSDTLLKLKNKQEIAADLMTNGTAMDTSGFKAMYKIMLLQDKDTNRGNYDALEVARDNPAIWDRTLEKIGQTERLEQAKTFSR